MQGAVLPDTLTREALADPAILRLSRKITLRVTDDKNELARREGYPPVDVDIHTVDGKIWSGCELYVKGHPSNPMTLEEVIEKFQRCAELSALPLAPEAMHAFCGLIADLETLEDVRGIPSYLAKHQTRG